MVIVNYQSFLHTKIQQQSQRCHDRLIRDSVMTKEFQSLVIRLYEYCQQLNIIKRRIQKLKFNSDRNEVIMPKLIDSEIRRIDTKAKEISTAYSLFLLGQKKFRVLSNEAKYFQSVLNILVTLAVDRCFSKEDAGHLATEVNRLFRTNTFNTRCCWPTFLNHGEKKLKKKTETSFRMFRRTVNGESSQIKPYVNNKTCFKSLYSRSPVISLWHPNSQYLSFALGRKEQGKKAVEL